MGSWISKLLAILSLLAVAKHPPPLCSPPIIVRALFSRMRFPGVFHACAFGNKDNALPCLRGSEFSVLKEHAVYLQSNALLVP